MVAPRSETRNLVAELGDLTGPVMRGGAGFNADQTGRQLLEKRQHLATPQLTPDDRFSRRINCMDLE